MLLQYTKYRSTIWRRQHCAHIAIAKHHHRFNCLRIYQNKIENLLQRIRLDSLAFSQSRSQFHSLLLSIHSLDMVVFSSALVSLRKIINLGKTKNLWSKIIFHKTKNTETDVHSLHLRNFLIYFAPEHIFQNEKKKKKRTKKEKELYIFCFSVIKMFFFFGIAAENCLEFLKTNETHRLKSETKNTQLKKKCAEEKSLRLAIQDQTKENQKCKFSHTNR